MASLLTQIKVRKDTYANIKDLVLTQGEPGFAHDTGDYAVGNGTNKFSDICFKLQKGVISSSESADNAVARFDGATGRVIQSSRATIGDDGKLTVISEEITGGDGLYLSNANAELRLQTVTATPTDYGVIQFTTNVDTTKRNLFLDLGVNSFVVGAPTSTPDTTYKVKIDGTVGTTNAITSNGGFIHGNLTVPNGNTKDDYVLLAGGGTKAVSDFATDTALINLTYYVKGTQTASTNAWTGSLTQISALYEGLTIRYRLPYAGTSSGATLNLTLSNGTTTGAKKIYRYGTTTQITTHFAAGSIITMTYDGTNWIVDAFYDSNNYAYVRQYQHGENKAGATNKYPLLARYNLTNKNNSYDTAYSRFHTEAYVDISDGSLTAKGFKYNDATIGTNDYILLAGGGTKAVGDFATSNHRHTFTASGTVSQPTFTGTKTTLTIKITPAGTVSQPTFTGDEMTSSGNYTPEGTVSTPTITVTPNTTTINSITAVGSLPAWNSSYDETTQHVTVSWSAGTLPTKGSNTTVVTGIKSATSSQPSFTGTAGTISVTGTPGGTVSQPTFQGSEGSGSMEYTPAGTVSQPTFTGTANQQTSTAVS